MTGSHSTMRKDRRVEQEIQLGLVCSCMPLSGADGGEFTGDIHLELLGRVYRAEVKAPREFDNLHGCPADAELLLLKADRQLPLAVLPLSQLAKLTAGETSEARP